MRYSVILYALAVAALLGSPAESAADDKASSATRSSNARAETQSTVDRHRNKSQHQQTIREHRQATSHGNEKHDHKKDKHKNKDAEKAEKPADKEVE